MSEFFRVWEGRFKVDSKSDWIDFASCGQPPAEIHDFSGLLKSATPLFLDLGPNLNHFELKWIHFH